MLYESSLSVRLDTWLTANVKESGCYVVGAAKNGRHDEEQTSRCSMGRSCVIDAATYFGQIGEIAYDPVEDRVQCHLCGRWLRMVGGTHLKVVHQCTLAEYRDAFRLPLSTATCTPELSKTFREAAAQRHAQPDRTAGFGFSVERPPQRGKVGRAIGAPWPSCGPHSSWNGTRSKTATSIPRR
jgi:hypothetical protein